MTVKQAAEFLRCHPSTIYRMLRTGQIPFKLGSERFGQKIRPGRVIETVSPTLPHVVPHAKLVRYGTGG